MGKNINSKVVSVRLPIWAAEWLQERADAHEVSLNAMLSGFLLARIEEVMKEGD